MGDEASTDNPSLSHLNFYLIKKTLEEKLFYLQNH